MFPYEIVPRERILESLDRADTLLRWAFDDDDDDDEQDRSRGAALRFALETYRHCAVAIESSEDLTLARALHRVITALVEHEHDRHETGHLGVALNALTRLLRRGLPIDKSTAALARHDDEQIRLSLASGLRPTGPAERALLEGLVSDPVTAVRKAARASLAEHGDAPWWAGKWNSCPASRLLPEEIDEAGPALHEVSELLDAPSWELYGTESASLPKLARALRVLPHALALEALEIASKPAQAYAILKLVPILGEALRWEGGVDTYMRLLIHWASHTEGLSVRDATIAIAMTAPPPIRHEIFRRCVGLAISDPRDDSRPWYDTPGWLAATVAGHVWPAEAKVTELLEAIFRVGEGEERGYPSRQMELVNALLLPGVDCTEIHPKLFRARLEGYPAEWRSIGYRIDHVLARAPKSVVRSIAEECLHADSDATKTWGLEQLLGPAFDRKLDGSPRARVAALLANPALRRRVLESWGLTAKALPELRALLVSDQLSYRDAGAVVECIARLFGGVAESVDVDDDSVERTLASRTTEQKNAGIFLASPSKRTPPSEAEWAALERARSRDVSTETDERVRVFAHTLRPGAWTASERSDLVAFMEHFREGNCDASVGLHLAHALCAKPTLEHLALVDEVLAHCDPRARPLLKKAPVRFRKVLGITTAAPEEAGPSGRDDDAWPGDD